MKRKSKKSTAGVSLPVAITFLVVMALIATFTFRQVAMHTQQIDGYTDIQNTYLGALSGLNASSTEGLAIEELNMADGFDYTVGAGETIQGKVLQSMIQAYEANDTDFPFSDDGNTDVQFGSYRHDDEDPGVYLEDSVVGVARNMYFGQQTVVSTILLAERVDLAGGTPDGDSPWDNALFAGSGGSGKLINGNVTIHGSVHILGDDIDETDVAIELSGGASIYNNYDGMPSDIEDNLSENTREIDEDDDGTAEYTGKTNGAWDINGLESLRSKLRVRNGFVSINGNSEIGEASPDSGSKGNALGIYVNNNWQGNATSNGVPVSGHTFSDNGYAADYGDYDGNANPGFPRFADEVTVNDPTSATCDEITVTYFDKNDTSSYYHLDIIPYDGDVILEPNVAVTAIVASAPAAPAGPSIGDEFVMANASSAVMGSGLIGVTAGAASFLLAPPPVADPAVTDGNFYWNSTTGEGAWDTTPGYNDVDDDGTYMPTLAEILDSSQSPVLPATPTLPNKDNVYDCSDPDAPVGPTDNEGEYFIWWDADTATLYVSGRNLINGNIDILSGTGSKDTINYQGIGSILVYDGDDDGDGGQATIEVNMYTTDFPVGNLLLMMSEVDMYIGNSSQIEIMGAFYSEGTVIMDKQNELAGALVGDFFDFGGQVPSVYQVPMLEVAFTNYELSIKPIGDQGSGGGLGGDDSDGDVWFELGVPLTGTD